MDRSITGSEQLLAHFEAGILARLSRVTGRPVSAVGVGRSRKGRAGVQGAVPE